MILPHLFEFINRSIYAILILEKDGTMRKVMILILIIAILNYNTNVFADTSVQYEYSGIENSESVEDMEEKSIISSEGSIEEDITEIQTITDEPACILTEETIIEESMVYTTELEEGDTVLLSDIYETAGESEEQDAAVLPDKEEETVEESQEQSTTIVSDKIEEEDTEYIENSTEEITEELEVLSSEISADEARIDLENHNIYSVSVPTQTMAYLNPGNLSGEGQIFSEQFIVENYGNTDVVVRINNIKIESYSPESIYEFSRDEIIDNQTEEKKINVNMVWENDGDKSEKILNVIEGVSDEDVLILKAAEYDENGEFVSLRESSRGRFYFTGTLNTNANIVWQEKDFSVRFNYELVYAQGEEDTDIEIEDEKESADLTERDTHIEDEERESGTETADGATVSETTESETLSSGIEESGIADSQGLGQDISNITDIKNKK